MRPQLSGQSDVQPGHSARSFHIPVTRLPTTSTGRELAAARGAAVLWVPRMLSHHATCKRRQGKVRHLSPHPRRLREITRLRTTQERHPSLPIDTSAISASPSEAAGLHPMVDTPGCMLGIDYESSNIATAWAEVFVDGGGCYPVPAMAKE
jgi:hypothetical protein